MTAMSSLRRTKNSARREGPKKRLSFAVTSDNDTTEEHNDTNNQPGTSIASSDPSCIITELGMCYNPKAVHRSIQEHDTLPMKECRRNNLVSAINFASVSGTTANVLIVGEKILGEKFKDYLLASHQQQPEIQELKGKMNLNITCEKTLTPAMTPAAHFIIFLFMMDTYKSIMNLSAILNSYNEDTLPGKRILVITVHSNQGCYKHCTDLAQFHNLLNSNQLMHFPWKEQGRLEDMEVKKILKLLYKSVGYHKGASLLTDYLMQLSIHWYE